MINRKSIINLITYISKNQKTLCYYLSKTEQIWNINARKIFLKFMNSQIYLNLFKLQLSLKVLLIILSFYIELSVFKFRSSD